MGHCNREVLFLSCLFPRKVSQVALVSNPLLFLPALHADAVFVEEASLLYAAKKDASTEEARNAKQA